MCHISKGVTAKTKVPIVAVGTTGQPAAIVQTGRGAITGELLNFSMNFKFFCLRASRLERFHQFFALGRIPFDCFFALTLARNHAFLSHWADSFL